MTQTPSQSTNRVPLIILLFMAFGVPTAAGVAFAEKITQNPGPWLALAILYEILIIILGFLSKVWQKLEGKWSDRVADWIDTRVLSVFSGYKKHYLQHLIYQHRSFDVKGLSTQGVYTLELEQVFVELSLVSKPAHRTSTDPFQKAPRELRAGQHPIWDYLKSAKMANQHLAIIGAPGSGKSTLLKHMTLALATSKRKYNSVDLPRKLPVLLFLRTLAEAVEAGANLSLAQAVCDNLVRSNGPAAPVGWLEKQINLGRCLIMLDGLDEIADPQARKTMADWVEKQMVACGKNRFIVTSRPFGYQSNPLTGVTVFEVCPFTHTQVKRFVQNWYLANEVMGAQKDDPGVRLMAQQGAEDLLERISGSAALSTLAVNPLLLTMIANVHRYRSSLPGRRVELYAEICEVFLGKRQQARGLELDLTPAQKQRVLQPLAFYLMYKAAREISLADAVMVIREPLARISPQTAVADFLKTIENFSGLLIERENGVYGFAHLTFQEYLAAVYVHEQRLEEMLKRQVNNSWWHETIRLYSAQADATPILVACLTSDKPPVSALTLAIECRAEAREIRPDMRERLDCLLNQGIEDADPERRCIVAEALLSQRIHSLIRIDEDTLADATLITHAEYQLFLDEKRIIDQYYMPDHWQTYQFPSGQGYQPVVGVRATDADAFCLWLSERELGEWKYRVPHSGESLPNILGVAGYWQKSREGGRWQLVLSDVIRADLQSQLRVVYTNARDRASAIAHKRISDRAFRRALARGRNSDLSNDDFEHALERAHDRDNDSARTLDRALNRALNRALDRDLSRTLDFNRDRTLKLDFDNALDFDYVLDHALDYNSYTQDSVDTVLDAYFVLALLEARVKGEFPALEGIRIVKERHRNVSSG
ncbi:hypothetical protein ANAEL_02756 [Anaerolineales bacterium]|nr:hypothetical protein ANAEL_02756 [Anaerolineales bacterium]